MVFTSPTFLFAFLPIALILYYLAPRSIKNSILLLFSLLFYAWGEVFHVAIMLVSIIANYLSGICVGRARESDSHGKAKLYLTIGITVNLLLLIAFKYANFITDNVNILFAQINLTPVDLQPIHLPLGISFYTFQSISYIVDVYRKEVPVQKNMINLALYISLFPQLIAGPIVRYHTIARQITSRICSMELFAGGAQRFIYGLAKKMLIANPLGEVADTVFASTGNELTMPLAWIGILTYTLQIYFDFSGYSDMAIGLGRMFGFRFKENFNYPYIATSLREFWKRWHISLSTWFRDYLYIPLGGSRVSPVRTYLNLLIVFILTGLWHGASWNFLIWGLFHGAFLTLEHAGFKNTLPNIWRPLRHAYLLFIIITAWVFFRHDSFSGALHYLQVMYDLSRLQTTPYQFAQVLSHEAVYAFMFGVVLATPVYQYARERIADICGDDGFRLAACGCVPKLALLASLLLVSLFKVASSTYNPFIYFRF